MILLRDAAGSYNDSDKHTGWTEQHEVSDIDSLVANMQEALAGDENAPKPRMYEVLEVQVVRKVRVGRRVETSVVVDVNEEGGE